MSWENKAQVHTCWNHGRRKVKVAGWKNTRVNIRYAKEEKGQMEVQNLDEKSLNEKMMRGNCARDLDIEHQIEGTCFYLNGFWFEGRIECTCWNCLTGVSDCRSLADLSRMEEDEDTGSPGTSWGNEGCSFPLPGTSSLDAISIQAPINLLKYRKLQKIIFASSCCTWNITLGSLYTTEGEVCWGKARQTRYTKIGAYGFSFVFFFSSRAGHGSSRAFQMDGRTSVGFP